jgi:hypothetical protein
VKARAIVYVVGSAIVGASCGPPRAIVVDCEPISATKLRGVNTVKVNGNFPPYVPRKTDDPHLVLAVLVALEHGMVDDPAAEARARLQRPANGMLGLEYRRAGKPGHNLQTIYFDAGEFRPPRYRKEFVDAVTAAYQGGKDVGTFDFEHADFAKPIPPKH